MIFKRKIYSKLLDWKNECNGTKALLIEGARRIGKSTIVMEFAKNELVFVSAIDGNSLSVIFISEAPRKLPRPIPRVVRARPVTF